MALGASEASIFLYTTVYAYEYSFLQKIGKLTDSQIGNRVGVKKIIHIQIAIHVYDYEYIHKCLKSIFVIKLTE